MLNLNGRVYFLAALYHIRGGFSHLPSFIKKFAGELTPLPYERDAVLEKVQQIRRLYTQVSQPIGNEEALKLMLAEDLREVEKVLQDDLIASEIDKRRDIKAVLNRCRDTAVDKLLSIGIQISTPPIRYVDKLPEPYAHQGYQALVADQGDKERYGMDPGIYFPESRLRPFYSEFLLSHELIHVILGKISPNLLARGLEEGIAELIGAMYLSNHILGKNLTINLFIYNRLSYGHQQFWELYMDATRQATFLYQRFGLQGIVELMKSGREKLKKVENQCLRMQFDRIDLSKGQPDEDLTDISDFLSLAFVRNLVVSPLAKYLSRYIYPDCTVADAIEAAHVDREAGIKALKELKKRIYIASFFDESDDFDAELINLSDCVFLSKGSVIRYEIPEFTRR